MSAETIISEIQKLPPEDRRRVAAFVRQGAAPSAEPTAERSVAGILTRALVPGRTSLPHEMANLILGAAIPPQELDLVDGLLERKRDVGLSDEEETRLQNYLHANSLLIELKSSVRLARNVVSLHGIRSGRAPDSAPRHVLPGLPESV